MFPIPGLTTWDWKQLWHKSSLYLYARLHCSSGSLQAQPMISFMNGAYLCVFSAFTLLNICGQRNRQLIYRCAKSIMSGLNSSFSSVASQPSRWLKTLIPHCSQWNWFICICFHKVSTCPNFAECHIVSSYLLNHFTLFCRTIVVLSKRKR